MAIFTPLILSIKNYRENCRVKMNKGKEVLGLFNAKKRGRGATPLPPSKRRKLNFSRPI